MRKSLEMLKEKDFPFLESSNLSLQECCILLDTILPEEATIEEIKLFLLTAKRLNLDPLNKEIWLLKNGRSSPAVFYTGRDGLIHIAHASKNFAGISAKTIDDEKGYPIKAVVSVWRKDSSIPFEYEIKTAEYIKTGSKSWEKYPSAMSIKVAEVAALRRAFDVRGIRTFEEDALEDYLGKKPVKRRGKEGEGLFSQKNFQEENEKESEENEKESPVKQFILEQERQIEAEEDKNTTEDISEKQKLQQRIILTGKLATWKLDRTEVLKHLQSLGYILKPNLPPADFEKICLEIDKLGQTKQQEGGKK